MTGVGDKTYHWFDIRMWNRSELMEIKLEFGANIDVGSFVLRSVAVLGGREDCQKLEIGKSVLGELI